MKFIGPLEFKLVAPMPEKLKTTAMHFYEVPPGTSEKCIIVVPTCSGIGATTNSSKDMTLQNFCKIFANFFPHRSFFLAHRSIPHPSNQMTMA